MLSILQISECLAVNICITSCNFLEFQMLVLGKWKGLKEDQEFKTNLGYIRRPPNLQNQRNKQKNFLECQETGRHTILTKCKRGNVGMSCQVQLLEEWCHYNVA